MVNIPREKTLDSALALLKEGNTFISSRCKRYHSDIFCTRLLFKKTYCIHGAEAARIFYRNGALARRGAIPGTTLRLLQDKGSVATLDDDAHHARKAMFMSLMSSASIYQLTQRAEFHWQQRAVQWQQKDAVDIFPELEKILFQAVCDWTCVPVKASEINLHTEQISAMIDGAGAVGKRNIYGLLKRRSCEKWLENIILQTRANQISPPKNSVLAVIACHREADKKLLHPGVAAVELLNILRPTVAVARYWLFMIIALHHYPRCRQHILVGSPEYTLWFVQEVRRYYPFFPFIGGIVRKDFNWREHTFPRGCRLLLDVYGTNRDPDIWQYPDTFEPERFRDRLIDPYNFIPQGGGDYLTDHRCAGEQITLALMRTAANLLTGNMSYRLEEATYNIDFTRMPAMPHTTVIMHDIKLHKPNP